MKESEAFLLNLDRFRTTAISAGMPLLFPIYRREPYLVLQMFV